MHMERSESVSTNLNTANHALMNAKENTQVLKDVYAGIQACNQNMKSRRVPGRRVNNLCESLCSLHQASVKLEHEVNTHSELVNDIKNTAAKTFGAALEVKQNKLMDRCSSYHLPDS